MLSMPVRRLSLTRAFSRAAILGFIVLVIWRLNSLRCQDSALWICWGDVNDLKRASSTAIPEKMVVIAKTKNDDTNWVQEDLTE